MADQSLTQNASLGNQPPKMVDKKPGRMTGVGGFHNTSKPKSAPAKLNTAGKMPGPSKSPPQQGKLRMSGHAGAHRLGGKLKI